MTPKDTTKKEKASAPSFYRSLTSIYFMILYQRYNIEKPKSSIPGFISWKTYQRTESDNQWSYSNTALYVLPDG